MAEVGAHLVPSSLDSPSVFEVLAQENLHRSLRPACLHLIQVFVQKFPRYKHLFKYYHEIYTVIDLIVQNHFLKYYASSFAENFYGLKRVPLNSAVVKGGKLAWKIRGKSLLCLVIVPYIQVLLNKKFRKERELEADGIRHDERWLQRTRRIFLFLYPWLYFVWQAAVFAYQLAFTLGRVHVHSPLVHFSGTQLTTMTQDDVTLATASFKFPNLHSTSLPEFIASVTKSTIHNFAVGLTWSLSVGAFFIQFLEWWNASNSTFVASSQSYVPPPPKINLLSANTDSQICPLCFKKRINDTALSTSGYVFCYRCIHQYLQQNGACPITKYISSIDHLIRLYPPD